VHSLHSAPIPASTAATAAGCSGRRRERGIALLVMLTLIGLWAMLLFIGQLSARQLNVLGEGKAASSLREAKEEILADSVFQKPVSASGYLSMPDIGEHMNALKEGLAAANFGGNAKDHSVIGKFPWRTLDTGPLRDAEGECLWYVVSGRFKNASQTDVLNWDTPGQIDLLDAKG